MNTRTIEYLIKERGAGFDLRLEKSTKGIVVPVPVIVESEILGEKRAILYWHGDDEDSKQREFPLCVSPDFFDKELAADPKCCDVRFTGSLSELPGGQNSVKEYHAGCYSRNLKEETSLVCGIISGMNFIFEIVCIADPGIGIIAPKLYFKKSE